jgi:hypothetical protein
MDFTTVFKKHSCTGGCAYNPSCSGDRDQMGHGSKPAWANSLQDPILKKLITTKGLGAGGVAQGEGPEYKP